MQALVNSTVRIISFRDSSVVYKSVYFNTPSCVNTPPRCEGNGGIAPRMLKRRTRSKYSSLLHSGSAARPASYPMGTDSYLLESTAAGSSFPPVWRLRMHGAISPLHHTPPFLDKYVIKHRDNFTLGYNR
jgi:hypothetical protein